MRIPSLVAVTLVAATLVAAPTAAGAAVRAPHHDWLLAADSAADTVTVVDTTTGRRTGTITHVELGTHAGTVQLGHARVAFIDESKPRLDVVSISSSGRPSITASYAIPDADGRWERAGWLATDTTRRYVAVGSDFDGSTDQRVTVIDLQKKKAVTAAITTNEVTLATTGQTGTEEMETFLVGSPLRLVVTSGGALDSYSVAGILRSPSGSTVTPKRTATTAFGAYPHGPIANATGTVIGSTLHDGIETVPLTTAGFGASRSTAYPVAAVQSYRPRLAPNGETAVGTQAGVDSPASALLTSSSTRLKRVATVNLGVGSFTRAAVTPDYAAAVVTANGVDTLKLVARDRGGLYGGAVTSLTLPSLGQTWTGTRFLAASDDGSQLFVSRAGTGTVLVVDVASGRPSVRGAVALPSALADGGYLATVDPEQRPYDLSGR